jgi:hypothetical protein
MGAVGASGFRPIVVARRTTGGGDLPFPHMTDTTTTFAFSPKLGRYAQSGVKSSPSMCHHQRCSY